MRAELVLLTWSCIVACAQQPSSWERIGDLRVNHGHATWESPESLARDLRSPDKAVRLRALKLAGLDENTQFLADAGPNEIELRYASLAGGRAKQAIVEFEVASYAYAAVAVPLQNGWKRIAVFECWCKYENALLDDFVRIDYGSRDSRFTSASEWRRHGSL